VKAVEAVFEHRCARTASAGVEPVAVQGGMGSNRCFVLSRSQSGARARNRGNVR